MNPNSALPPLGRCPLLLPFLGAIFGNLTAEFSLWPLLVFLIVTSIYGGLLLNNPPLIAGALTALLMACWHNKNIQNQNNLASLLAKKHEIQLKGTLIETNSSGIIRRLFRTESKALLTLENLPENFKTGQKLLLTGHPIRPQKARNPTSWNPQKNLWKRGIAGSIQVTSTQNIGWSQGLPLLRGWAEDCRQRLLPRLTKGIQQQAARDLIRGITLGERAKESRVFDNFRKTGTMHIFAVSGLHVGLLALIISSTGRILRIPPRPLFWLIIFSMFTYAFITGLRPPALRASLMGTLFLGRFLLLRRPSTINNLFAAALIVLTIDSFQLWQTGFQLSFFVVAVILIIEPHLWKPIAPLLDHDPYLPKSLWNRCQIITHWTRNKIGKMFTVSLAAWTGSAPLSIFYFGWFTPIAALASIWMVMIAFLILALAFLSLAIGSLIPAAGNQLNSCNGHLALLGKNSAETISHLPGAWTRIDPPAPWRNGLCIFDINYGGAAIHLDIGGGTLIDAGNKANFWFEVQPALQKHNLNCDSIIATHNDSKHIAGLRSAINYYPIKQALIPIESHRNSLASLVTTAQQNQITLHQAQENAIFTLNPHTHLEILSPGNNHMSRADDRGLILLLHLHQWRILITGDAGYETETSLLASKRNLSADIWICGRNRKDSMGQDPFIHAINPKVIIATEKSYPASEQIPPTWRRWLESKKIKFFSQKEHGAVFVRPSKKQLIISSYLSKKKVILKN